MSDPVKVYKVELLIIDTDRLGADGVRDVIENVHYPNHCVSPIVLSTETREVEWTDDHPLNRRDTMPAAVTELFAPDDWHARMLEARGVEDMCPICTGTGRRWYGNTSTWRGGIGGASMTPDVCDRCWGTGDRFRTGADLRKLRDEESKRVNVEAVDRLMRAAGANLETARADVLEIAAAIRAATTKRGRSRWFASLAESLAGALESGARR